MAKKKKRGKYNESAWKNAIVKALLEKGFTKAGAKKTARFTMQRHIECLRRDRSLKDKKQGGKTAAQPKPDTSEKCLSSQAGVVYIPPAPF